MPIKGGTPNGNRFLKNRAELCYQLFGGGKSERLLWFWFEAEVNVLRDEGLVDTKVTLFPTKDTSTFDVVVVLANVYRMRRLGLTKPVVVV